VKHHLPQEGQTGLLADIGGTFTRLAIVGADGELTHLATRANAEFAGPLALFCSYLRGLPAKLPPPARAAVAVASTVIGDEVRMTNLDWSFSASALAEGLGLGSLQVLNDFTALALSLPRLLPGDIVQIGHGDAAPDCPMAVLGPGTGLGVSGLIPHAHGWTPLATEGGHVTLAPCDAEEGRLLEWLRQRYGHASAERVLSGSGLIDLYNYVTAGKGETIASAERVTDLAINLNDAHARRVFDIFFALLGTVAGNVALTLGARGGVYLAGGILPRVLDLLQASAFRERFVAKGRFRAYLEAIPTVVIVDPYPAFKGLKSVLR
jgi:glucokinase